MLHEKLLVLGQFLFDIIKRSVNLVLGSWFFIFTVVWVFPNFIEFLSRIRDIVYIDFTLLVTLWIIVTLWFIFTNVILLTLWFIFTHFILFTFIFILTFVIIITLVIIIFWFLLTVSFSFTKEIANTSFVVIFCINRPSCLPSDWSACLWAIPSLVKVSWGISITTLRRKLMLVNAWQSLFTVQV